MRSYNFFYTLSKNRKIGLILYGVVAAAAIVYIETGTAVKERKVLRESDTLMNPYPRIGERDVPTALFDLLGDSEAPVNRQKVIRLRSRDSGKQILSFYRKDFRKRGYRIVDDNTAAIVAEGKGFSIMVSTLPGKDDTRIFITIEKIPDRNKSDKR